MASPQISKNHSGSLSVSSSVYGSTAESIFERSPDYESQQHEMEAMNNLKGVDMLDISINC